MKPEVERDWDDYQHQSACGAGGEPCNGCERLLGGEMETEVVWDARDEMTEYVKKHTAPLSDVQENTTDG